VLKYTINQLPSYRWAINVYYEGGRVTSIWSFGTWDEAQDWANKFL